MDKFSRKENWGNLAPLNEEDKELLENGATLYFRMKETLLETESLCLMLEMALRHTERDILTRTAADILLMFIRPCLEKLRTQIGEL